MLSLVRGDVRHSCEYISAMGSRTLDAVAMIYPAFSGFMVDVKVLQIVVEIDRSSTEVPAEESSVRGEHGGDIDVAFTTQRDGNAGLPLMEVGDDSGGKLA